MKPRPATRGRERRSASASATVGAPVLRHERVDLAGPQHVDVEGDVHGVGAGHRPRDVVVDPVLLHEGDLGRIEAARADERDVLRAHGALVDRHPERHPPFVPGGRGVRRVEVSVGVEPDDGEPPVPLSEPADRADVRAATAAQHERAPRELRRHGRRLLLERVGLDHRRLGPVERERGAVLHRVAAVAEGRADANQRGRELAAAAVALVLVVERDRRERPAVRALRAERAHSAFSQVSARRTWRIPTRS